MKLLFNLILLLGLYTTTSFSQDNDLVQKVKYLFPEGDIRWIKYYNGTLQDAAELRMVLGYDGAYCRGIMYYSNSGEQFTLNGFWRKDSIFLNEIDANEKQTASIAAKFDIATLEGVWKSNYHNTTNTLTFANVPSLEVSTLPCDQLQWTHRYTGFFDQYDIDLLLQRTNATQIEGQAYFKSFQKTFFCKGQIDKNEDINVSIYEQWDKPVGTLCLSAKKGITSLAGHLTMYSKNKNYGTLKATDDLSTMCLEYGDYTALYKMSCPKFEEETPAALWFQQNVASWFKSTQEHLATLQNEYIGNAPEVRNSVQSFAECMVDFYNGQLMSGIFYYRNSWSSQYAEQPFILDVKAGTMLFPQQIFKNEKDFELIKQNAIKAFLQKQTNDSKDNGFNEWLKEQSFESMTLRKEGLVLNSNRHAKYGVQTIVIPFKTVQSNIQVKSPIMILSKM